MGQAVQRENTATLLSVIPASREANLLALA